jgi:hypothetical protein
MCRKLGNRNAQREKKRARMGDGDGELGKSTRLLRVEPHIHDRKNLIVITATSKMIMLASTQEHCFSELSVRANNV